MKMSFFFFYKIRETGGWNRSCLARGRGLVPVEGEEVEIGRRMSMVQKRYTYVSGKMTPIETLPEMRERKEKKNNGEGEFKYDKFDTL
jgi:hypothetical protein